MRTGSHLVVVSGYQIYVRAEVGAAPLPQMQREEECGVLTSCHWLAPASWGGPFKHISMLNHCLAVFWAKQPTETGISPIHTQCGDCCSSICSIDDEDIVEPSIMHTYIPAL